MTLVTRAVLVCLSLAACSSTALLRGQQEPSATGVTAWRIVHADHEPGNWLTYSGQYNGQRFSRLDRINHRNVRDLRVKWVRQFPTSVPVETSPLVVNGILYATMPPNDVVALDARSGLKFWHRIHVLPDQLNICCGRVNLGLAMLGDTLYLGTLDAQLVALDSRTGHVRWTIPVADNRDGYSITSAPLVVKNMIVTGVAGGELGIRGFLSAYDADSGALMWRTHTIPGPGEPGHETWEGDSWKTGAAATWVTGTYDPTLDLIYWGVGNPGPDFNGEVRRGDNLYSDSVLALEADTGAIRWHFQFTPHDVWDWDACQIPVLVDLPLGGEPRKLMLFANRNGFYYVLDRESGQFLAAAEFAKQTWADGIDPSGRPRVRPE